MSNMYDGGNLDEQCAFDCFAGIYPHEAYETYPDRFWEYFHRKFPAVSRDAMEKMLKETDEVRGKDLRGIKVEEC